MQTAMASGSNESLRSNVSSASFVSLSSPKSFAVRKPRISMGSGEGKRKHRLSVTRATSRSDSKSRDRSRSNSVKSSCTKSQKLCQSSSSVKMNKQKKCGKNKCYGDEIKGKKSVSKENHPNSKKAGKVSLAAFNKKHNLVRYGVIIKYCFICLNISYKL